MNEHKPPTLDYARAPKPRRRGGLALLFVIVGIFALVGVIELVRRALPTC